MRSRLGRFLAIAPADTWFFLGVSAFAAVLLIAYWFWTYDWAGTILLFGFAVATGINGVRLLLAHPPLRAATPPPSRQASGTARSETPAAAREATTAPPSAPGRPEEPLSPAGEPAPGLPDADRPFLDERGRLPAPSIAPLALALAAALISTSIVFGPWLLVIAILPLAWGAIGWLRDADAEYRAVDAEDAPPEARRGMSADGLPAASSPGPGSADRREVPGDAPARP